MGDGQSEETKGPSKVKPKVDIEAERRKVFQDLVASAPLKEEYRDKFNHLPKEQRPLVTNRGERDTNQEPDLRSASLSVRVEGHLPPIIRKKESGHTR